MGSLFHFDILRNPCGRLSICKKRKLLQIVKLDGEVVDFKTSVLVKELLINFEGFAVKSSREALIYLPPNFELKLGKIYYLVPCDEKSKKEDDIIQAEPRTHPVKRIKILITKQQLQELLSKKISAESIILGRIDKSDNSFNSTRNWKPSLKSIPEESEF